MWAAFPFATGNIWSREDASSPSNLAKANARKRLDVHICLANAIVRRLGKAEIGHEGEEEGLQLDHRHPRADACLNAVQSEFDTDDYVSFDSLEGRQRT